MHLKKNINYLSACVISTLVTLSLQTLGQTGFNARELFASFPKSAVTEFRSSNGAPGPGYWQNKVDYTIRATLDTSNNSLKGSVEIAYVNNSPDKLNSLWLQLDQNIYRENSIADYSAGRTRTHTTGYHFEKVSLIYNGKESNADYIVNDTRMQIRLQQALPHAATIKIRIRYRYDVPGAFGGRTDYFSTQNGKIYEIAQWYPRMCVYDDLNGWNTLPFIGTGEFYCEYGNFDYSITVPANMIVVGSGELINEAENYSSNQLARLRKARMSDETVFVRTKEEVIAEANQSRSNSSGSSKTKTWHFKMQNSRDVAFGASAAYILDAARINLPNNKKALAMSAYPVESTGPTAWNRSTEYMKKSIEHFSEKWLPYPYPVAINEAGIAGGMEYPGIVFDGMNSKGKGLYWVTAHEIGHTWFPMIVGSSERRHAWMDEGFNTFMDVYAAESFNKGEFAPKRDGEYAPGGGNPSDEIIPWLKDPNAPSMMTRADMVIGKYRHPFSYFKPALGLVLLREAILGHDRFDYAFKKYVERWAYKHPSPDDFFRTMESEGGEDLGYFWRQWFVKNWLFDVEINSVEEKEGVSVITLGNKEKSAYPLKISATFQNGEKADFSIPVEVWYKGETYSFKLYNQSLLESIVIDPENLLPDSDRKNNMWKR